MSAKTVSYSAIDAQHLRYTDQSGMLDANMNGHVPEAPSVFAELTFTLGSTALSIENPGFNTIEAGSSKVTKSSTFNAKIMELYLDTATSTCQVMFTTTRAILDSMISQLGTSKLHQGMTVGIKSVSSNQFYDQNQQKLGNYITVKEAVTVYLDEGAAGAFQSQLNSCADAFATSTAHSSLNSCGFTFAFLGIWTAGSVSGFTNTTKSQMMVASTAPAA